MALEVKQGARAVAHAVGLCEPKVISAYPITPQTIIVEELAQMVADGELNAEYLRVESEHSAISAVTGASATGVRTYTATASQGLALMHEILYITAGMRLPVVMGVANRALSAPLNIFNDWQDSISERDTGWLQFYCETNQEAVDTHIQAYKIAEDKRVLLPIMVCMDGQYLTHTYEPVDVPDDLKDFLPDYKPEHAYLDPARPITQGAWGMQAEYSKLRRELSDAIDRTPDVIRKAHDDFAKTFGRSYGNAFIEKYGESDTVIVSMGSVCGTLKDVADEQKFEILRVRCFRPFPKRDVVKELVNKKLVIVLEKDISLGTGAGSLFSEVRNAMYDFGGPKIVGFVGGLGGSDIPIRDVEKMYVQATAMKDGEIGWLK
jgi:pyruvate ferredoxin oxidoreductase alpha subunit